MDKTERLYRDKLQEIKRFFAFATIGFINTSVDFGIFTLMTKIFGFHYGISQAVSYSCGTINSFLLNSMLTFGDIKHTNAVSDRFAKFITVNLFSLAATVLFLQLCIDILHFNNMVSKVAVIIISQVINYLGYKMWVFKNGDK